MHVSIELNEYTDQLKKVIKVLITLIASSSSRYNQFNEYVCRSWGGYRTG